MGIGRFQNLDSGGNRSASCWSVTAVLDCQKHGKGWCKSSVYVYARRQPRSDLSHLNERYGVSVSAALLAACSVPMRREKVGAIGAQKDSAGLDSCCGHRQRRSNI